MRLTGSWSTAVAPVHGGEMDAQPGLLGGKIFGTSNSLTSFYRIHISIFFLIFFLGGSRREIEIQQTLMS